MRLFFSWFFVTNFEINAIIIIIVVVVIIIVVIVVIVVVVVVAVVVALDDRDRCVPESTPTHTGHTHYRYAGQSMTSAAKNTNTQ